MTRLREAAQKLREIAKLHSSPFHAASILDVATALEAEPEGDAAAPTVTPDKPPEHVCGSSGFGLGLEDVCAACQWWKLQWELDRQTIPKHDHLAAIAERDAEIEWLKGKVAALEPMLNKAVKQSFQIEDLQALVASLQPAPEAADAASLSDSTGAMASAWFDTQGAGAAIERVFPVSGAEAKIQAHMKLVGAYAIAYREYLNVDENEGGEALDAVIAVEASARRLQGRDNG